jgi:hypothetical protein
MKLKISDIVIVWQDCNAFLCADCVGCDGLHFHVFHVRGFYFWTFLEHMKWDKGNRHRQISIFAKECLAAHRQCLHPMRCQFCHLIKAQFNIFIFSIILLRSICQINITNPCKAL